MGNYFPDGMPLPGPDRITKPFWDFCKQHELRFQMCSRCGTYRFHPTPTCFKCQSFDHEWVQSSGKGKVYTYMIVHHPPHPAAAKVVPYNVAVIEMEDCGGVRVASNIIDCPNDDIHVGMPVELAWEDTNPTLTQYRFRKRQ